MTNYTINHIEVDGHTYWTILNNDSNEYFNGYDFMGSVNWTTNQDECYWMNREEAMEITRDLNLADEPAEPEEDPAKKEYLLKTVCEDIKQASVKTGKQIADIYEMDQIAGIYSHMEVWDLDTMKRISLLDLVDPILENKRWMEQEYRDYCENEAYGDY